MKKSTKIKLILLGIAILVAYTSVSFYMDYNYYDFDPEKEIIEWEGQHEIETVIIKDKIDGFPYIIYINYDEELITKLHCGGANSSAHISHDHPDGPELTTYSWFNDNKKNHRVVWGYSKPENTKNITVNGKHVDDSVVIKYTYKEKEYVMDFWYIVLEDDFNYKVRNTGDDYDLVNESRVYLEDNE